MSCRNCFPDPTRYNGFNPTDCAGQCLESARLPRSFGFGTISCVPPTTAAVAASPKLLGRVCWHLRVKHYSIRTEQVYVDWIRRIILFHRKRHPNEMGEKEITEFLTHLAAEKTCRCLYAKPSFRNTPVSLSASARVKTRFHRQCPARHTPGQAARRIDAERNTRCSRAPQRRVSPDG